jgi:hypothetical protein
VAEDDLSAAAGLFVAIGTAAAQVVVASAGGNAVGVVQHPGAAGEAVTVLRSPARARVVCGGTIAVGAAVAADAAGKAVAATTGDLVLGLAEEAGVTNQVITVSLTDAHVAP